MCVQVATTIAPFMVGTMLALSTIIARLGDRDSDSALIDVLKEVLTFATSREGETLSTLRLEHETG